MNDDDKKENERLTKELNTLKLAHETTSSKTFKDS